MEKITIDKAVKYLTVDVKSSAMTSEQRERHQKYLSQLNNEQKAELDGYVNQYLQAYENAYRYVSLDLMPTVGMSLGSYRDSMRIAEEGIKRLWQIVLDKTEA